MASKRAYGATVEPRPKQDGTVSYDVRYRLDGKSRRQSFTNPRAAEKWAEVVRSVGPTAALEYLQLTSKPGTPTVAEYAETYISAKSGIEPKTRDHYRMFMRLHIGPTFGHLPMDAVSPAAIAAWVNKAHADGRAAKTIQNHHGFLSGMFEDAVFANIIGRNPCAKTRLPETEQLEMVFLTPDEFVQLLGYIPTAYETFVLFLASTGARWGEATALRAADFDLNAAVAVVRISRAWKWAREKGYYIGPPKTKKSKRTISIPESLREPIRELIAEDNEYVFTNNRGNPIRQAQFWEWVWSPARRLANGLPAFDRARSNKDMPWKARSKGPWEGREPAKTPLGKMPRVHDLRHGHVYWLISAGFSLPVIQRRLGHESIQTTIDTYGHLAPDMMDAPAAGIDRILSGAMPELLP